MANFYYVKSGGSATGDAGRVATTRSTGSFATKGAAAYYNSISAALAATTPPADGDYILCSSAHALSDTSAITLTMPAEITIMSVDDSNCDQYLAGASETTDNSTTTLDYRILGAQSKRVSWYGMTLQCEDNFDFGSSAISGSIQYYKDCTFNWQASAVNTGFWCYGDGSTVIFEDCTINPTYASWAIDGSNGPRVIMKNCGGTATTAVNDLFRNDGNGAMRLTCENCDFSGIMATSADVVSIPSVNNDGFFAKFRHCLFPTGWTAFTSPTLRNFDIEFIGCGTADEYFSYLRYYYNAGCVAQEDTATYLDATYDGSTGFSLKLSTDAATWPTFPFKQKLITLPNQDLTSGKSYEIEFTSATASLGDNDVWIEAQYIDNTSEALGTVVSTQNSDVFAATGAAHTTTGTGTWGGVTGSLGNDYRETATIASLANVANATVEIYACIGKPSITVAFDPQPNIT